jgi:hypothetical protein
VAASGEFLAELGGDDAGAAVGGVAGDPDFHGRGSPGPSVVYHGQIGQHSTGKAALRGSEIINVRPVSKHSI